MNLFDDLPDICRRNVPLAPLTWFKLGGPAQYLIEPKTAKQLATVVRRCHKTRTPIRFLGLGANVLVNDDGVRGAVVRLTQDAFMETRFDGPRVTAGGGVSLAKLVIACVRRGLSGLEHVAGIPASVGGAIRMNCGGKFGEIGTAVRSVRVVNPAGEIFVRERDDLEFRYRYCGLGSDQVIAATFQLNKTDPHALRERFDEIWMYKQNTQPPLGVQSAGCIFRNPNRQSAGELIDRAGLKGLRHGTAAVSDRHANFIVADVPGRASDIIELIEMVRERVAEAHGIDLTPEVQIW